MPFDLFISYSRRDNQQGRITQLVDRIKADFASFAQRELATFFDQHEIHGMQDWRQRILQGLRESRLLLACLSPSYLMSEYCEWEFVEYLKHEIGHLHGFNGVAPIYFVEVPDWDGKEFEQDCAAWVAELRKRQRFDLRPWHEQGEDALREAAVQERMGKLNAQIAQTIRRGERAEQSLGNVDAHNPHFIGRTASLRNLRDNFVKPGHIGVVTAVNGVGGLGKTALAIEYAHAFADEYGGGRWQVRCAGKDDLRLALADLATPIGFEFTDDERQDADLQFERVRRELKKLADARAPHRCLLLLDNVERGDMSKPGLLDPALIAKLNTGDWLHVLATTRLGPNELHGTHKDRTFLAIDELPPDDALALIESYQPGGSFRSEKERDASREIVRLLGSFTLAVESAAVYMGQFANDVTCEAFLARLKKEGLDGLDAAASQSSEGVLHGEKGLSATLKPTLERLDPAEILTLEYAALLPPDLVPLPWLRALVAKTFPEMERDAEPGYPDPWNNVLRRLFSLRLIQSTEMKSPHSELPPTSVRVHRLLKDVIKQANSQSMQSRLRDTLSHAVSRTNEHYKLQPKPENHWEILCIADFLTSILNIKGGVSFAEKLSGFVSQVAQVLRLAGFHQESSLLFKKSLDNLRIEGANSGLPFISALGSHAWELVELGQYDEAERTMKEAIALLETEKDATVEMRAAVLGNYGYLLVEQGRLSEAREVGQQVYDLVKAEYGPIHPETANRAVSVAQTFFKSSQYVKAESMLRDAAQVLEDSVGILSPMTLRALHAHSESLTKLGRWDEAEQILVRLLRIEEEAHGKDHPNVADDLCALGLLFQNRGRYEEAKVALRRALDIRILKFGLLHRDVSITLNNLALAHAADGGPESRKEGESILEMALEIAEKTLGLNHPDVAIRLGNLAVSYCESGNLKKAEKSLKRSIQILCMQSRQEADVQSDLKVHVEALAIVLKRMGLGMSKIKRCITDLVTSCGVGILIMGENNAQKSVPATAVKIRGNALCACGSGKKVKKCCGPYRSN